MRQEDYHVAVVWLWGLRSEEKQLDVVKKQRKTGTRGPKDGEWRGPQQEDRQGDRRRSGGLSSSPCHPARDTGAEHRSVSWLRSQYKEVVPLWCRNRERPLFSLPFLLFTEILGRSSPVLVWVSFLDTDALIFLLIPELVAFSLLCAGSCHVATAAQVL